MFFVPLVSAILFYYALFYYVLFFPFLLFQDDTIVRSFPPLRSPPALCIRQDWRIGRRLRSSPPSLFRPENLIILTFSKPQNLHISFFCITFVPDFG